MSHSANEDEHYPDDPEKARHQPTYTKGTQSEPTGEPSLASMTQEPHREQPTADDDSVSEALGSTTPLGWFVDYAINPDPKRMAPSPPFENESEAWRALVHDFEGRLVKKG